ncbi:DUF1616 domain-containing protein [Candidatus Pacearchaeota archaeon]|nr:DUF1616 domain-containing protein [Candidatus Pacearchaeota archaeon]
MNKLNNAKIKWIIGIILAILVLNIISVIIVAFSNISYKESLRIVFGAVYVLFLPGFIMSYIFFPKTKSIEEKIKSEAENSKEIDLIERIALSFALSIAIVPLLVFYLNLIGVKISFLNTFMTILGVISISAIILLVKNKKKVD